MSWEGVAAAIRGHVPPSRSASLWNRRQMSGTPSSGAAWEQGRDSLADTPSWSRGLRASGAQRERAGAGVGTGVGPILGR